MKSKLIWLFLAVLTLFWPILLHPNDILYPTFSPFSDLMVIHWSKAHLMAQNPGLPYWTPLILSGMPLAANQLAMLYYPPAWLFLILPLGPVFNLLYIFHLLLGGMGIFLLLREKYKVSSTAALLGSLTFALNGKWLAHIAGGHVSMVGAIGWMPWAIFGLLMLLEEESQTVHSRIKWAFLIALALAMQIVTHTLLVIYTVYILAAIVVWYFFSIRPKNWGSAFKRLWLPFAIIPVLAGLLGGSQLLPLLELAQFSNRSLTLAQAAEFAVTPTQLLIGLLLPSTQAGHELIIYMGLIPLLLAPFGLTRRNRWTLFYGLLFLFALLFALGSATPIHQLFYYIVPGFRWVRTPARMFFVGSLALAILVGFGTEQLKQTRWSTPWLTRLTIALGSLTLFVGLGLAFGFNQLNRAAFALAFLPLTGLSLILLRVRRIISFPLATTLLGLALFLDLGSFDISMMKFISQEEALSPGRPTAEYLSQKSGRFRIYSPSYSLPMQTAATAGIQLADGVEPVHVAVYDEYMARAGGYHDPSFSVTLPPFGEKSPDVALKDVQPDLKLLGLLNVKYLASAFPMTWPGLEFETEINGTYIYQNAHLLPHAWMTYQSVPTQEDWLAQLENSNDLTIISVEKGPFLDGQKEISPVTITHYSANRIELETEIPEPAWLFLSEIWYPGWQATINNDPTPVQIEKVNGIFRGLYLDQAGDYQIKLEYQPPGRWLTVFTIGPMILSLLWLFWADRKS